MTVKRCPCGKWEQLRRGLCHACYERDRRAGRIEPLVPSRAARAHIVLLCVNGWRYREIARAAGIDRSQVAWIVRGRDHIQAKTDRRICGIDPATRDCYLRPAWTDERRATQRWPVWSEERRREQPRKAWATRRANQYARSYEGMRDEWSRRHPVPTPIPQPGEWSENALCAQVDCEIFFPAKGQPTTDAKRICRKCEVRQQCLEYALENDIRYGVFGGLSVKQRGKRP
jgi:WhiB family redox-sensing transcriptional regulator